MRKRKIGIAWLLAFAMLMIQLGASDVAVAEENVIDIVELAQEENVHVEDAVAEEVVSEEVEVAVSEENLGANETETTTVEEQDTEFMAAQTMSTEGEENFASAEEAESSEETEEESLANGTYLIPARILQAANNAESMANDAVESAVITVNNESITLSLNMQSLMGVYLQSMTYQDDANNTVNLAVTKVENGNNVQFSMPIAESVEEVVVGFSFEIAPGTPMTQSARLLLDWDNLTFFAELADDAEENVEQGGDSQQDGNVNQGENNNQNENQNNNQDNHNNQGGNANIPLDKNNLADGIYEVQVALWNATQNQASMASGSVVKLARIAVRNGVSTMYLYTQTMTLGNITASLQYLQVESGGGYTQAAVNTRNAAGDPTSFSFVMPHKNDYIAVRVNPEVEIMGNTYIDARLRLDWNSLKAVSDSTNLASPPSTSGVAGIGGAGASSGPVNTGDATNSAFLILSFIISTIVIVEYVKRKNLLERNYISL